MDLQSTQIQERKNRGSNVFIVILIILVLALGVLFALEVTGHSLFNKNDSSNENKDTLNDSNNKNKDTLNDSNNENKDTLNDDVTETSNFKVMSGEYITGAMTIILFRGNVYVNFDNCTDGCDTTTPTYKAIYNLSSSYQKYLTEDYRDLFGNDFHGVRLNVSDVNNVFTVMDGQDFIPCDQGLALIKNDGTISLITFQSIMLNRLTPKNVPGLKNIVRVVDANANSTVAIAPNYVAVDASGKTYTLHDYIKENDLLTQ